MKNFKNICSGKNLVGCRRGGFETLPYARLGWLALLFLLTTFIYLAPYALAVSPEKGNFVTLGRAENEQFIDEKIDLKASPGVSDVIMAKVKSGTAVIVLDKKTVESKNFYIVSTVGKDGGMIGWVSEDYIYEIIPEPPRE